jgi:hypothetical protein
MRKSTSLALAFAAAIAILAAAQPAISAEETEVIRIDRPGAASTAPQSINVLGDIVGIANTDAAGKPHGFLRDSDGQYATVDLAGETATLARGINNSDRITGQFVDTSGRTHAFLLFHGSVDTIDVPGAAATFGRGINAIGAVTGNYVDLSSGQPKTRGFVTTR